jgi:hypothetical protein
MPATGRRPRDPNERPADMAPASAQKMVWLASKAVAFRSGTCRGSGRAWRGTSAANAPPDRRGALQIRRILNSVAHLPVNLRLADPSGAGEHLVGPPSVPSVGHMVENRRPLMQAVVSRRYQRGRFRSHNKRSFETEADLVLAANERGRPEDSLTARSRTAFTRRRPERSEAVADAAQNTVKESLRLTVAGPDRGPR